MLDSIELKTLAIQMAAAMPPAQSAAVDYPAIDNSPRARKMREILRIADAHGWRSAITLYLDTRGESHIADLSDPQLDDLHGRMLGYLDAAETGCSLADCLPAN